MKEILVIDDHPIVVFSLERIISSYIPGYNVVSYSDADSVINHIYNNSPSLIIQDLNISGVNPTDLIKKIKMVNPKIPILVFTSNSEKTHGRFFLKLGARGFLNKESSSDEIALAIKKVLDGKLYISESLYEMMTNDMIENRGGSALDKLSKREYDVLIKLTQGLSPSEIAAELNLKPQTITTFKQNIFEKLSVNNIIELYEIVKLGTH